MGEHPSEALGLHPALGEVGVVDDEAATFFASALRLIFTAIWRVMELYEVPPVDAPAIHKAVEHILLAGEQLAETAARVIGGVLHGEERGQDEQFQHLREGELAVRILDRDDHFGLYGEAFHQCCYALYRPAGVIVFEKTLEFTDYLSIFCSWQKGSIYLFDNHNIVIITELSNTFAFFIRILFHLRNLS